MLRLELLDEKATAGTLTDHDGRTLSALSNQVRLLARDPPASGQGSRTRLSRWTHERTPQSSGAECNPRRH